FARCRSTQLADTFRVPSSNHLMCRLAGSHDTSFTLVKGLIQSMRLASSRQKPSGSFTERAYICSYLSRLMKARSRHAFGTGMSVSDIGASLPVIRILSGPRDGFNPSCAFFGWVHHQGHKGHQVSHAEAAEEKEYRPPSAAKQNLAERAAISVLNSASSA